MDRLKGSLLWLIPALLAFSLLLGTWNTGRFYMLVSACFILAFVIVGLVYPKWLMVRLHFKLESIPEEITPKVPVFLKLKTFNPGWIARRNLLLTIAIQTSDEKALENRFVLKKVKSNFSSQDINMGVMHRGRYLLSNAVTVSTAMPFGVLKESKQVAVNQRELLVRPYCFDVRSEIFEQGTHFGYAAIQARQCSGANTEFYGVREFQHGDSIKLIDWKSSAKHGELIVREFQETTQTSTIIVLDLSIDEGKNNEYEVFEETVSIAASVTNALIRKNKSIGLSSHRITLMPGSDEAHRIKVIDYLTEIQVTPECCYISQIEKLIESLQKPETLLIFLNMEKGLRKSFDEMLYELIAKGCAIHLIVFNSTDQEAERYVMPNLILWLVPEGGDIETLFA